MANFSRKFFIKSFGCQMNVADSERMSWILEQRGLERATDVAEADVVVLNTCHIREKASEKLFFELGRVRGKEVLGVVGCVAQAMGDLVLKRAPYVDFVLGPQSIHKLGEVMDGIALRRERKAVHGGVAMKMKSPVILDFDVIGKFRAPYEARSDMGVSAFLTVQEGCNQFCAFCVVPYTRGAHYSRPVEDIVAEARHLVTRGVKEITLVGQNVNAYDGQDILGSQRSLADLIKIVVDKVPEVLRWRYTTSHPVEMTDDLIGLHGECEKLMPYLHLPIQSGSDSVLRRMNRKHTLDDYRRIVGRLREAREDIALTTDIIVGHPGESDEDFAMTLRAIAEFDYAGGYFFKYSEREGTLSAGFRDRVDEAVKASRLESVKCLFDAQARRFMMAFKGKRVSVLFEGVGRKAGQHKGKSSWLHSVHADFGGLGDFDPSGVELECEITNIKSNSMEAKVLSGMPLLEGERRMRGGF